VTEQRGIGPDPRSRDDHTAEVDEPGVLVAAYWEHHRHASSTDRTERMSADRLNWARREVSERVRTQPMEAVALLVEIAEGAPGDEALAYLGAGPVEDLLRLHTDQVVVDQIEEAARRSANFRSALRCAWYDDDVPSDVRDRLRRFGDPL
jgi:hypothetical protein